MSRTNNDVEQMINPLTGRRIQIGGSKYWELLHKGIIEEMPMPELKPKPKKELEGDVLKAKCEDAEHAKEIKRRLQKEHPLEEGKIYVVVDNMIYVRRKNGKKLTRKVMTDEMSKSALKTTTQLAKDPAILKRLEDGDENLLRDVKILLQQNLINNARLEDIQENNLIGENKKIIKDAKGSKAHIGKQTKTTESATSERRRATKQKFISDSERISTDDASCGDTRTSAVRKNSTKTRNIRRTEVSESESSETSSSEFE